MGRPYQNTMSWVKDLKSTFSKTGDFVMEACAGTNFTEKASMLFHQPRKSAGCEMDPERLSAARSDFVLLSVFQFLNPGLDISANGKVEAPGNAFRNETDAFLARKKAIV